MRIKGRESLRRKLLALPKLARAEIRKALAEGATEMRDQARAFVPKRTGALHDSISFTFGAFKAENSNVRGVAAGGKLQDKDLSVTIHAGDAKAFYAAWVEFGTAPRENKGRFEGSANPGTPAQPYFFPAYRLTRKRMRGKLTRSYRRAAQKIAAIRSAGGAG